LENIQVQRAKEAFNVVLRGGTLTTEQRTYLDSLTPLTKEQREQRDRRTYTPLSSSSTTGGLTLLPTILDDVTSVLKTYGALASVCNNIEMDTGDPVQIPIIDSTGDDGTIVDESAPIPLGPNPTLAQLSAPIGAKQWTTGIIQMSNALFSDAKNSIVDTFLREFTSRYARGVSKYVVTSTNGLLANTTGMAGVALGVATAPTWDELTNLQGSIPSAYLANATYAFSTATYLYFRTLKNATTNDYLWQPAEYLQGKISGLPFVICDNLDSLGVGKKPVFLADWQQGITIRRVGGIAVRVYRELFQSSLQIGISGDTRFDARVILPQAFAYLHG
jgi:HK97 family phage major capsid protein